MTDPIEILRQRLLDYRAALRLPHDSESLDDARRLLASDCAAKLPLLLGELKSARLRIAELERAFDLIAPMARAYARDTVGFSEASNLRAGEAGKAGEA